MPDEEKTDQKPAGTTVMVAVTLAEGSPFTALQLVDAALRLMNKGTKFKFTHAVEGLQDRKVATGGKDTAEPAAAGAAPPVNPHRSQKTTSRKTPPPAGSKHPPTAGTEANDSGPAAGTQKDGS